MNSTKRPNDVYDVIGVGIGPFNLGLAALADSVPEINALFFERNESFNWHPGMLIEGTTLQVPFLADLVSMADVTSKYSFLNYLQQHNRLYSFYFLEDFHIPRQEYNHYCRWVAEQLDPCRFGMNVESISLVESNPEALLRCGSRIGRTEGKRFITRGILRLALGRARTFPMRSQTLWGARCSIQPSI